MLKTMCNYGVDLSKTENYFTQEFSFLTTTCIDINFCLDNYIIINYIYPSLKETYTMDLHIITYIVNYYEVKLLRGLKQREFVINYDQSFMNLNTKTRKNCYHCLKEISVRILVKQFALNFCEVIVNLAFSLINY